MHNWGICHSGRCASMVVRCCWKLPLLVFGDRWSRGFLASISNSQCHRQCRCEEGYHCRDEWSSGHRSASTGFCSCCSRRVAVSDEVAGCCTMQSSYSQRHSLVSIAMRALSNSNEPAWFPCCDLCFIRLPLSQGRRCSRVLRITTVQKCSLCDASCERLGGFLLVVVKFTKSMH